MAVFAANFPFMTKRLFGLWLPAGAKRDVGRFDKSLSLHVLELVVMYAWVGTVAWLIERDAGQVAPQRWEFFAVTACLFVTFAFPGFVWRFLLKGR